MRLSFGIKESLAIVAMILIVSFAGHIIFFDHHHFEEDALGATHLSASFHVDDRKWLAFVALVAMMACAMVIRSILWNFFVAWAYVADILLREKKSYLTKMFESGILHPKLCG